MNSKMILRAGPRRGFSMVEVMVGMLVLASASVLVSASLSSSNSLIDAGRTKAEAAAVANQQLEWYVHYPEASSLPSALKIAKVINGPSGLKTVHNTGDQLHKDNADLLLDTDDAAKSGMPYEAPLSTSHTDFFYDKQMLLWGAKVDSPSGNGDPTGETTRKYQCDVWARPPGGTKTRLLYSASQLSVTLDSRSGK